MNKVAELPASQRTELFTATAERRGFGLVAVVEKDFWVCWALKQIFSHPDLKDKLLFKGGTSLSKVFGLIDRFSEDIDLVLDWNLVTDQDPMGKRSKSQQGKLNESLKEASLEYISDTMLGRLEEAFGSHCTAEVIEDEDAQNHVVRIKYPETVSSGSLRPFLQLEIGPLASWLPHSEYIVRPYAAEDFPEQFDDPECSVRAIDATRTFWEKAMILHREAHRAVGANVPERYSRHYYDLYFMAKSDVKQAAFDDLKLLHEVIEFNQRFYACAWAKYDLAAPGTIQLVPPHHVLDVLRKDHDSMQEMIFGRNPSFDEILDGISVLEKEINQLG
jgi:hypothetical protein